MASGDCTLWVIINSSVVGLITNPAGGEFPFIRSSEGNYECSDGSEITDTLFTVDIANSETESPFYCINGINCPLFNTMFYAEGSSTFSTASISSRNGMNVWVREVGITYPLCMIYYYIYIIYCFYLDDIMFLCNILATCAPTDSPTPSPTAAPTISPTPSPTSLPTQLPSSFPTSPTPSPSNAPTASPTPSPSNSPTISPTPSPTAIPTESLTPPPTTSPTPSPTTSPTISPTTSPTVSPTLSPTPAPTLSPTLSPTIAPTATPTPGPTNTPSSSPISEYVFSRTFWPKNNYDANAIPSCTDYIDLKITVQDGSDIAMFNIKTNRLNTWIGIWFPSDDPSGPYFDTTKNVTDGYAIIIERGPITVNEYICTNINCNIQTIQNLTNINSTETNNILYISFERQLNTNDINDFVIKNPAYYLYPSCNPILITAGYGLNTESLLSQSTNYDWVYSFVYMYDESIMYNGMCIINCFQYISF